MIDRDRMPNEVFQAAQELWEFHRLGEALAPADGILVFGSNDLRVAEQAAALFHAGLAPWVLFSGNRGRMTQHWAETEAAALARVAVEAGVPGGAILIEDRATNTGENIRFSQELLASENLSPKSAIVVQKPYMERRTRAALEVQWLELEIVISAPDLSFSDYCNEDFPPEEVIAAMAGDFQRLLDYPALGFATEQLIPPQAQAAYEVLVAAGYNSQLL